MKFRETCFYDGINDRTHLRYDFMYEGRQYGLDLIAPDDEPRPTEGQMYTARCVIGRQFGRRCVHIEPVGVRIPDHQRIVELTPVLPFDWTRPEYTDEWEDTFWRRLAAPRHGNRIAREKCAKRGKK